VPVATDRTRIELRIRAERHSDGDALVAAARSFIAEDIAACERIQDAVGSDRFAVGPLCRTHEAPVVAFQAHVLDAVGELGATGAVASGDVGWQEVATTAELAEPGAFASAVVGTTPVLVVLGTDGVLRGFVNMCRHRGMTLVPPTACGDTGRALLCPYHAWNFGLDGELRSVPQRAEQFPDLDLEDWGLLTVPVAEHDGRVYVHAR
jgi:nitrite reductase/ring-hydroxylating ferredoxin subunit